MTNYLRPIIDANLPVVPSPRKEKNRSGSHFVQILLKLNKSNIVLKYKWLFLYPTGMHAFAFRPLSGKQKRNKFSANSAALR